MTRQLHDFNGRFSTIECLKDHICKELHSEFPRRTLLDVGYFEGHQSQKVWIVPEKDLDSMYSKFKAGSEILLWVEIVEHHDNDDSDEPERKRKSLLDHLVRREKRTVLILSMTCYSLSTKNHFLFHN